MVCSGAKSILDLPLTLERLETEGVPVIGYRTDTLPAFYTRSSGLPVDQRVDSAVDAARIVASARMMQLGPGVLITVPVPAAHELAGQEAEAAIHQAVEEADAQAIRGKAITPFVLARVAELTGDASRRANTALLENNARVAAEIAVELAR